MAKQYEDFGKRLTEERKKRGLKQKDCLYALGEPTLQMLSSWENGKSFPSIHYLKRIAFYYNVSLDYLIFGVKNKPDSIPDNYADLFKHLEAILATGLFNKNNNNNNMLNMFQINTYDKNIIEFYEKIQKLEYAKDVYGEVKFNDVHNEIINSYLDKKIPNK